MNKVWRLLENIFIIAAFPVAYWVGYVMVSDIVFFWQHGVEKQATVKSLEQTRPGFRGATSYHYLLEMDGRELSRSFAIRLPVGESVTVLVSPNDSEDFILGSKDNNMFELFSLSVGGKVGAILIIATYLIIIYTTPGLIRRLIRNKGKFFVE